MSVIIFNCFRSLKILFEIRETETLDNDRLPWEKLLVYTPSSAFLQL